MPLLNRVLLISSLLLLPFALCAALPPCSIHPPKGASQEELVRLSKITEPEARIVAVAAVKADREAVVKSSELEVEQGCLVWSYDIKVPGKRGIMAQRGRGCAYCRKTGYFGRTGIYEILKMDDPMRDLIEQKADSVILREKAIQGGMATLKDAALAKLARGITTFDEILRVTGV